QRPSHAVARVGPGVRDEEDAGRRLLLVPPEEERAGRGPVGDRPVLYADRVLGDGLALGGGRLLAGWLHRLHVGHRKPSWHRQGGLGRRRSGFTWLRHRNN